MATVITRTLVGSWLFKCLLVGRLVIIYREIISLGDENTANARWEPAGTVPVTRQRR
jgi:hypothetical protein